MKIVGYRDQTLGREDAERLTVDLAATLAAADLNIEVDLDNSLTLAGFWQVMSHWAHTGSHGLTIDQLNERVTWVNVSPAINQSRRQFCSSCWIMMKRRLFVWRRAILQIRNNTYASQDLAYTLRPRRPCAGLARDTRGHHFGRTA